MSSAPDIEAMRSILQRELGDQVAQRALDALLADDSWRTSPALLIEIEAAGEVADLDAERVLDALRLAEEMQDVQLLSAGLPVSFSAHSGSDLAQVRRMVWAVAEDEGLRVTDVRISPR